MSSRFYSVFAAVLMAAAMWIWAQKILIAHQQVQATAREIPRGNLSDLYPRWLGARELLLRGRDPYGPDITREIQTGYYGRPLDATRPNDPKDQQAFAYPVYVVFFLAPTVKLPFPLVQRVFLGLLVVLTAASIPMWLRALGWRTSSVGKFLWIVLALGCFPAVQGFKLQQLTLLVAGLLAAAFSALASGYFAAAGILLALASIKPQLVALPVVVLCVWSLGNWRERRRLVLGLGLTMLLLCAGGEVVLPGWIGKFRTASRAYLQYTGGGTSVLDVELTPTWGRLVAGILVAVLVYFAWRLRQTPVESREFGWLVGLTLATTLMVIPMVAPYNQMLLVPVFMVVVRGIRPLWRAGGLPRFFVVLTALSVFWPWVMAAALVAALLVVPAPMVQRAWVLPVLSNFAIPTLTLGLVLIGWKAMRDSE